jgi:hypothetical protein
MPAEQLGIFTMRLIDIRNSLRHLRTMPITLRSGTQIAAVFNFFASDAVNATPLTPELFDSMQNRIL